MSTAPDTDTPAYRGPGSWTAADVAGYLVAGVTPRVMRRVLTAWPHPGDYESAWRTGASRLGADGWPRPVAPYHGVPAGGWIALAGTPDYPAQLMVAPNPPLLLFGLGQMTALTAGLAVVGSRQMSSYGQIVAQTATAAVADLGVPIISGGALGCDTVAHTVALETGAPTVAVVATGADCPAPAQNQALFEQVVASGGAIVSEHPFGTGPDAPGVAPYAARLQARNRIIAGLACATVLAEGTGHSGSVRTVWSTLALGRPVLVASPRAHARHLPGAQAPLALAASTARTQEQLRQMGAPAAVAGRFAGRAPLASGVACDRDDLAVLARAAVLLSPHHRAVRGRDTRLLPHAA